MYETPKIVAPYKSRGNVFGYNDISWYASGDVYFINIKPDSNLNLKYILGVLNSKLYYLWFYFKGKRKGSMFELYQKPLSETPIITSGNNDYVLKVESLVNDMINNKLYNIEIQKQIDDLIYKIVGLSDEQINVVEDLYEKTINQIDE